MNEKHLSLFTRVEDGLPEKEGRYSQECLLILDGQVSSGCYNFESKRWVQIQGRNEIIVCPSNWLNLYTLTTKQKAIELAEDAYRTSLVDWIAKDAFEPKNFTDFINQNKDRL